MTGRGFVYYQWFMNKVVKAGVLTALKSFERKKNWGLIYPGKIMIGVTGEEK